MQVILGRPLVSLSLSFSKISKGCESLRLRVIELSSPGPPFTAEVASGVEDLVATLDTFSCKGRDSILLAALLQSLLERALPLPGLYLKPTYRMYYCRHPESEEPRQSPYISSLLICDSKRKISFVHSSHFFWEAWEYLLFMGEAKAPPGTR